MLIVVAIHAAADSPNALLWCLTSVLFASLLPIGYVLVGCGGKNYLTATFQFVASDAFRSL